MKVFNLFLAVCMLTAIALPAKADACGSHSYRGSYHNDRHAVAGYNDDMRDDYMEAKGSSYSRSMAEVDAPRFAEYRSIFGSGSYAVAGYSNTWSPWTSGGTWVNVNGQRVWATQDDFVWVDDRWTWADDDTAVVYFDDDRVSLTSNDWINHDRFDLDIDKDKLDLDTDQFKMPDKLEIK